MFKKILFFSFLLVYNLSFSQLTIVDEKFESGLKPVNYKYFDSLDKIVIEKGTHTKGMSVNNHIKTICTYDRFSNKTILTENDNLMYAEYSPSGKTIRATKFVATTLTGKEHKYISEKTNFTKHKKDKIFKTTPYFNDEFEWGISNKKRKERKNINFIKDDLILVKTEIYSRKNNIYNIEKPNTNRLLGEKFAKWFRKKPNYLVKPAVRSFFEIITKSISNDYRKCTVYKTYYDEKGKKVDDVAFNVELKKYYLVFSMNNNTEETFGANSMTFDNNLAINGIIDDPETNDVYIYGLMGEKARGGNFSSNTPIGYYIFKFDKDGNKIWSKTQIIKDKLFNRGLVLIRAEIDVLIKDETISVYNRVKSGKDNSVFKHTFSIQKGEPIKELNKASTLSKMKNTYAQINFNYFLFAHDKLKNHKNKAFDSTTIVALEEKTEISNYINNIKLSKNKILFNTIITDSGYWLIESDNKNYYKILFFNK